MSLANSFLMVLKSPFLWLDKMDECPELISLQSISWHVLEGPLHEYSVYASVTIYKVTWRQETNPTFSEGMAQAHRPQAWQMCHTVRVHFSSNCAVFPTLNTGANQRIPKLFLGFMGLSQRYRELKNHLSVRISVRKILAEIASFQVTFPSQV